MDAWVSLCVERPASERLLQGKFSPQRRCCRCGFTSCDCPCVAKAILGASVAIPATVFVMVWSWEINPDVVEMAFCRFGSGCWRPLCPHRHSGPSWAARWAGVWSTLAALETETGVVGTELKASPVYECDSELPSTLEVRLNSGKRLSTMSCRWGSFSRRLSRRG